MPLNIDDLIPSAKKIQQEAALKEAEKAQEYATRAAAAEAVANGAGISLALCECAAGLST